MSRPKSRKGPSGPKGSSKGQRKAKAPRGSSGSPGGKKESQLVGKG